MPTLPVLYCKIQEKYVYIAVRYDGVTSNYKSTKIPLKGREKWDKKTKTIKGNDKKTGLLRSFETRLEELFYELNGQKISLNANLLMDYLWGLKDPYNDIPNVLGVLKEYVQLKKGEFEAAIIEKVTFGRYLKRLENFESFLVYKYKTKNLSLDQITQAIGKEYQNYLLTQKRYKPEIVNKDIGCMKAAFVYAVEKEWISFNPFRSVKLLAVQKNVKALTLEEVQQIIQLQHLDPKTEIIRDNFIFCCFTGLNYSDLRQLKPEHIAPSDGLLTLTQPRTKNNNPKLVLLNQIAISLIEKYASHCQKKGLVFPTYPDQKANDRLKVIAAQIGFKRFKLTTKIGRSTFSTLLANAGVKNDVLIRATGHTNTQTLEKHYISVYDKTVKEAQKSAWENLGLTAHPLQQ